MLASTVKPRVLPFQRNYNNHNSQGTLIRQTKNWLTAQKSPGVDVRSAYIDRMWSHDNEKYCQMISAMGGRKGQQCGIDGLVEKCADDVLIRSANMFFDVNVVAVRWVYYFNVATGYPCERIDYVFVQEAE